MATFIRPARVDVTEGGADWGGLVLITAAAAAVAAVVLFALAHLALLAVCAAVFVAVIGGYIAFTRWLASPGQFEKQFRPHRAARPVPRPARGLPAPRPRAIEAPRAVTDQSPHVNRDAVPRVP